MEEQQLTEEQKQKLKKLRRRVALRAAGFGVKFALSLILANFVVCLIDVLYVQNKGFVFIGSMISFFIIFRSHQHSLAQEHDRVKEEVKKILEN